jgi:hypothetical protein
MFQRKAQIPTRLRKVFRNCKPSSRLEKRFELLWRADFAHIESRTLIEIEGGIYVNGRHNSAGGFSCLPGD